MLISLQAARVTTGTPEHVDHDEVVAPRWVTIEDGCISAVGTQPHPHAAQFDLRPLQLWPAFTDRHATGTPLRRRQIARFAAAHNTVFATHDPDSESAVIEAAAMRAGICEFPLTLDAAAAARNNGLAIVMGAPNAWRGPSHLSNLSARDAIEAGVVDVLTSDYHSGPLSRAAVAVSEAGWLRSTPRWRCSPRIRVGSSRLRTAISAG